MGVNKKGDATCVPSIALHNYFITPAQYASPLYVRI